MPRRRTPPRSYDATGAAPYQLHSPDQIRGFFTGLDLIDPGVVPLPHWRPDPSPIPPTPSRPTAASPESPEPPGSWERKVRS
ncbi:SAM-dependent methyltransferase [Actinomadura sp. NPDC049753]|uniref:SAM-dependent methyltransferase n=1 Tax=Actinomadura sp. NPDC049753 TaxID=3154739 RepID=UPI00343EDD50